MIIIPEKIIINKRELQTGKHKAMSLVLFLIFWAGLLYLMRPLVVVVGWALAYFIFDSTLQNTDSAVAIGSVIDRYLPIVLALSLAFISWSVYNKLRFSGARDKRRSRGEPSRALTLQEISATSLLPAADITQMREAPMVICYFNEATGEIKEVECCPNLEDADMALAVKAKGEATRAALQEAEKALADFDDNFRLLPTGRARSEQLGTPPRPTRSEPLKPAAARLGSGHIELDLSPHEAELIKGGQPAATRTPLRK